VSEAANTNDPRVAVITGGAGDLAGAIQRELSQQGYSVHAPRRGELDVREPHSVAAYFKQFTRVDLLITNAGITRDRLATRMSEDEFSEVLEVNLNGAMRCMHAALRKMTRQEAGHIVTIGSFSALSGPEGQANYAAAKAGLIAHTLSLAAEYGSRKIRVNCVLPGFMETRMTVGLSEEVKSAAKGKHVLRRFNTPDRVGRFIAFLDREMPHTSGQVFNLDSRIRRWT
jgi:3-oxoacyl-[acyl-carrier protein] reductase